MSAIALVRSAKRIRGRTARGAHTSVYSALADSSAGRERITSPMAPGRIRRRRIFAHRLKPVPPYTNEVAVELEEWVGRVFGRPVTDDFHRLSELDAALESLDQAFWDLSSNVLIAITDESIEWTVRDRFIRSFEMLFREFFAVRCRVV